MDAVIWFEPNITGSEPNSELDACLDTLSVYNHHHIHRLGYIISWLAYHSLSNLKVYFLKLRHVLCCRSALDDDSLWWHYYIEQLTLENATVCFLYIHRITTSYVDFSPAFLAMLLKNPCPHLLWQLATLVRRQVGNFPHVANERFKNVYLRSSCCIKLINGHTTSLRFPPWSDKAVFFSWA